MWETKIMFLKENMEAKELQENVFSGVALKKITKNISMWVLHYLS